MKNELLNWASQQREAEPFLPKQLKRISEPELGDVEEFWKNPLSGKIMAFRFPKDFGPKLNLDPNQSVVLGGMCLVNTLEMRKIYEKKIEFDSVRDFERWFRSWYPRIDQIHDAVGTPSGNCRKVVYVSEDFQFANRLSDYTGLDRVDLQKVLRLVHEQQGHPVLARYLKVLGYTGEVTVVYTSELVREMNLALRIWERILGFEFRNCDRDYAGVELMYTGFWLDVLGIKTSAIIYEAANKMILKGYLNLEDWFKSQPYGKEINANLGVAGYLPFLTTSGDASSLSFDSVPNCQNYNSFVISDCDVPWYVANLLFFKGSVIKEGPLALSKDKAKKMICLDLVQYYEEGA